jgi:hypothetical protein
VGGIDVAQKAAKTQWADPYMKQLIKAKKMRKLGWNHYAAMAKTRTATSSV